MFEFLKSTSTKIGKTLTYFFVETLDFSISFFLVTLQKIENGFLQILDFLASSEEYIRRHSEIPANTDINMETPENSLNRDNDRSTSEANNDHPVPHNLASQAVSPVLNESINVEIENPTPTNRETYEFTAFVVHESAVPQNIEGRTILEPIADESANISIENPPSSNRRTNIVVASVISEYIPALNTDYQRPRSNVINLNIIRETDNPKIIFLKRIDNIARFLDMKDRDHQVIKNYVINLPESENITNMGKSFIFQFRVLESKVFAKFQSTECFKAVSDFFGEKIKEISEVDADIKQAGNFNHDFSDEDIKEVNQELMIVAIYCRALMQKIDDKLSTIAPAEIDEVTRRSGGYIAQVNTSRGRG